MYRTCEHFRALNQFMTISAILLGFSQLIFVFNFVCSLFRGQGRRPEPVAQQHAGVDRAVAAAARQLRDDRRSSTAAPTNTACRAWRKTYLPQTAEHPAGVPEPVPVH